jgi:hypothetical protein
MYAKIKNGLVDVYPYSMNELRKDNPQTSFPEVMTKDVLASYGLVEVMETQQPDVDYRSIVSEGKPELVEGTWLQKWVVTSRTPDEIKKASESLRLRAYAKESDPLFFKWQRGEIAQEVWLAKVSEIKQRFPNN